MSGRRTVSEAPLQPAETDPLVAELSQALLTRGGFEAVTTNVQSAQVRFFGRVPQNRMAEWKIIMHQLLRQSETAEWTVDISKLYFLRGGGLIYGWRLLLGGAPLEVLPPVTQLVLTAPRPHAVVDEVTIPGRGRDRNVYKRGKGAAPTGQAVVGPAAIHAASRGGR